MCVSLVSLASSGVMLVEDDGCVHRDATSVRGGGDGIDRPPCFNVSGSELNRVWPLSFSIPASCSSFVPAAVNATAAVQTETCRSPAARLPVQEGTPRLFVHLESAH